MVRPFSRKAKKSEPLNTQDDELEEVVDAIKNIGEDKDKEEGEDKEQ